MKSTWRKKGRDKASRRDAKGGIEVYYANVSSWSPKAREYFEQEVRADALAVVETHLHGREYNHWKNRIRKWGYKVSGREAVRTYRSEKGTSGGCLICLLYTSPSPRDS